MNRVAGGVAIAAATILVALLVVIVLRPAVAPAPGATPGAALASGSARPSAPAATTGTAPAATASAPATSVLDDRFGFLVQTASMKWYVRGETGVDPIAEFEGYGFAASPDGTRLAYWRTASGDGIPALDIYALGPKTDRTLLALTNGQSGGGIAWSSDGTGLAIAVTTGSPGTVGGGTGSSALFTVDVAAGTRAQVAERSDGRVYWPIAWDRGAKLVAAGETGEGGFMSAYITFDVSATPAKTRTVPVTDRITMTSVKASSDQRWALGSPIDAPFTIKWWPIDDYSPGKYVPVPGGPGAAWRPGTTRFGLVGGDELSLYDVTTGQRTVVVAGMRGQHVFAFRPDGSAAIVAAQSAGDVTVIDLAIGRSALVQARGGIGPWVRLR